MNILITGIAGFIGSNLADYLLNKGHSVIGIDNLAYGVSDQVPSSADFIKADIRDSDIHKYFKNIDAVFHLAAKNCISDCQKNPVETASINTYGTVNVLDACRTADVKRVILAESSAVYEGSTIFPTSEEDENPLSFYAVSKYSKKFYSQAYARFHGLNITSLRYFNVYGPKQDYRRTIPPLMSAIIIKLLNNKIPVIYGDGTKRRDFIYIDDVNRFHELIINDNRSFGKTYNLGNGENYSVNEVFKIIESILQTGINPDYGDDLPGEAFQNLADITKSTQLGWSPEIGIREGIKRSIDYIKMVVMKKTE